MIDSDVMKYKRKIMGLIINNNNIVEAINATDIVNTDDLIYTHIFPFFKTTGISGISGTYITLKLNSTSIKKNDIYKQFILTLNILCRQDQMETEYKGSRVDVIAGELVQMFNWNSKIGFDLELFSDMEDPLNETYYIRELKFKTITTNSVENGVKIN